MARRSRYQADDHELAGIGQAAGADQQSPLPERRAESAERQSDAVEVVRNFQLRVKPFAGLEPVSAIIGEASVGA